MVPFEDDDTVPTRDREPFSSHNVDNWSTLGVEGVVHGHSLHLNEK